MSLMPGMTQLCWTKLGDVLEDLMPWVRCAKRVFTFFDGKKIFLSVAGLKMLGVEAAHEKKRPVTGLNS